MPGSLTSGPDPWDTRFGFFWYNDAEIFDDTSDDLERRVASMAAAGTNHVITFSVTHFRWSFYRHWDVITEAISRLVEACHAHGIKVTEHHSCHLTHNPMGEEEEARAADIFAAQSSSIDRWPHFLEDCEADPEIDGLPLSSFRQIDGRTGKWGRSWYRGWCMCFNNPDYRKAYFQYLETLYATGIDGIMTDDVQWFGETCACQHCQHLFHDQTGHHLPSPGEAWEAWYGNYDEPSYVAWLDFRFRSAEQFHWAVKAHYEGLGLQPLRPNYISDTLNRNSTAYTLDALPDLDWVFQECVFTHIIRYSWSDWAVESAHRFAVGRRRDIPAMAMFYADRDDTMNFTWALAMSWGVMYLNTPVGFSMNDREQGLRAFERRHAGLLRGQRRIARIGFYDSRTNRNLYEHAEARGLRQMKTWMQACYRQNVPIDLFQEEDLERMGDYSVVVLNEVAMLSEEEWTGFRSFVVNGGTLVWTGKTGVKDEKGADRPENALAALWGIESIKAAEDGEASTAFGIGKGRIVAVAADFALGPFEHLHNADRWQDGERRVPFTGVDGADKGTWLEVVDLLVGLLPAGSDLKVEHLPKDVTVTAFQSADGRSLMMHLVNTSQTLDLPAGSQVGHADTIPLPAHSGPPMVIRVRKPEELVGASPQAVRYHDPETAATVDLNVEDATCAVTVSVDPGLLRYYGLVEVTYGM